MRYTEEGFDPSRVTRKHDYVVVQMNTGEYGIAMRDRLLLMGTSQPDKWDVINGVRILCADLAGSPVSDVEALSQMGRDVRIVALPILM